MITAASCCWWTAPAIRSWAGSEPRSCRWAWKASCARPRGRSKRKRARSMRWRPSESCPSRNGVEVWMADAASGRSLLRQVIVDETPGGPNQDVIALQTAELLRTGLFPETPPAVPRPVPAPPVIVQSAPARSAGESALGTGVELLYSAGGASPAWQAWFSFQHLWSRRLGIALDVSAPFRRGTMSGPEGTADVGAIVVGVEMLARFRSERGRLFLTTGLGAGPVALLTKGHPSPEGSAQVESNSSTAYTALGFARITLGWKLSSWLGLGMSGAASERRSPASTFDLAATMQATGACRCWGRLCSRRSTGTEPPDIRHSDIPTRVPAGHRQSRCRTAAASR